MRYTTAMSRVLLLLLPLGLAACSGARPCVQQCKDDEAFFERCWDQLQAEGIQLSCYEDLDEMAQALEEAGSDPAQQQLVYQEWRTAGKSRACKSPSELTDQCITLTKAEFKVLDKDAKEARQAECDPEAADTGAPDPKREAIEAKDCDAFIEALGVP